MKRTLSLFYFSTAFFIAAQTTFAQTNRVVVMPDTNVYSALVSLRAPAVSEINGKVDYAGGNMNSAAGNNFSASITLPVSHQFGFQADALYSRISDLDFYGGAGHFFWRDPGIGLLGLTGGYLYRDGFDKINTFQAGAEGQFYYGPFTFGGFAGVGSIDYKYSTMLNGPANVGIESKPTRFIGRVSADYYPLENLRIGAAYINSFHDNLGEAEIEYQTPINGLALTGEAALGDNGYDQWLLGIRYYFGVTKTLRARQREDDPPGLTSSIRDDLNVYGAGIIRWANSILAKQQGSGNSNGSGGGDGGGFSIN